MSPRLPLWIKLAQVPPPFVRTGYPAVAQRADDRVLCRVELADDSASDMWVEIAQGRLLDDKDLATPIQAMTGLCHARKKSGRPATKPTDAGATQEQTGFWF